MKVVKMLTDDDGSKHHSNKWHGIQSHGDAERTICTGECFGEGESIAKYIVREGNITCQECISIIKWYKSIKI